MKWSISNIALPAYDHDAYFQRLAELGLQGIEVAPSRRWTETWAGLASADVTNYRKAVEGAGLHVVGLHSLLFDQQGLELFGGSEQRKSMFAFFVHLSAVCRDLGGRTLIWGGGRRRGALPPDEACKTAIDFFGELSAAIGDHGTCFCLEPLGPADTDFIHSVSESVEIVRAVAQPALRVQIDAKALFDNDEFTEDPFQEAGELLVHYHANEPGLEFLGSSGEIDHRAAGHYLRSVGYDRYVSIEQKMIGPENPMLAIERSVSILREAYR